MGNQQKHRKDKRRTIRFPVLNDYHVNVVYTSDIKKAALKSDKTRLVANGDRITNCDAITIHVMDEPESTIIFQHDASFGIIAHECWHVIRRMFEYFEMHLDSENVAYHLGYLVDQVVAI